MGAERPQKPRRGCFFEPCRGIFFFCCSASLRRFLAPDTLKWRIVALIENVRKLIISILHNPAHRERPRFLILGTFLHSSLLQLQSATGRTTLPTSCSLFARLSSRSFPFKTDSIHFQNSLQSITVPRVHSVSQSQVTWLLRL